MIEWIKIIVEKMIVDILLTIMNPQYILNRSKQIRAKELFRIWTERTYALLFCIVIGCYTCHLLLSKPLESNAEIIASPRQCPLTNFWIDEYNNKACKVCATGAIKIPSTNHKDSHVEGPTELDNNYKNFWFKNPYKKQPSASALRKAQIRWQYRREIANAHKKTGLPKNLIAAVIVQESNGNPRAVSHCGAQGLMQLMPSTAHQMGCKDPFNTYQNVLAGSKYLAIQLKKFKSKELALAAYNAGPGNVHRYKKIKETREYVPKVIRHEYELAMLGD